MLCKPAPVADPVALIRCALGLCPLMNRWPGEVLDKLAAVAHLGRYDRRTPIMVGERSRREVLLVAAGRLEVEGVNASGHRFVLSMHGPGEIVGLVRLLKNIRFVYDFQVHEGTVLVHLPGDPLLAILDEHPQLWRDVCLLMLSRLHEQIATQQRRALGQTANHVADALVHLALAHGQAVKGGSALSLRISQSDLAAMLAMSRQTVNKELHALALCGAIDAAYGRIIVRDLDALRRAAEAVQDCPPPVTRRPARRRGPLQT